MKKKRHSSEQIIRKLWEAEGMLSAGNNVANFIKQMDRDIPPATTSKQRPKRPKKKRR